MFAAMNYITRQTPEPQRQPSGEVQKSPDNDDDSAEHQKPSSELTQRIHIYKVYAN
jgi:hypothetical protein